jgi:Family of unknown function (DUF5681)
MTDDKPPSDLETVGYGKPPKKYRFVKGKSGNRNGRPPRKFRPTLSQAAEQPTNDIFLFENYRGVKVREGDRVTTMPAFQASTRSIVLASMKGDLRAHRYIAERVEKIEQNSHEKKQKEFLEVAALVEEWTRKIAKGIPFPEGRFPHPEDIRLNPVTLEVWVEGPMNAEGMADLDGARAFLRDTQTEIDDYAKCAKMNPTETHWREMQILNQDYFDRVNAVLPARYKIVPKNKI